jgi:hypothetical protein
MRVGGRCEIIGSEIMKPRDAASQNSITRIICVFREKRDSRSIEATERDTGI